MSEHNSSLTVNGRKITRRVKAHRTLLEFLRDELGLKGCKEGCGNGECGACTVILDGEAVRSCLILAVEAEGCQVQTIEGLSAGPAELSVIQQSFIDVGAVQCGYCAPGFVMATKALLDEDDDPSDEAISNAFGGHLCRCAIYSSYFEAVRLAAKRLRESDVEKEV